MELSVQKIVYIDNQDGILWGYKLQQSTFINTIKIKARQSIDELIEELILHGFSTSFAYKRCSGGLLFRHERRFSAVRRDFKMRAKSSVS